MNIQEAKEKWKKMPENTKRLIGMMAAGTLAIVAVCAVALALYGKGGEYSTLFTGLNNEEAQEVVALLQDENIDYRYNTASGAVQVPEESVDQTRARLLEKGYPKSGFSYDMYLNNAGLMATESDKKQYTLYELQDRLGAQIGLFDGVRDAKVTIAQAGEAKYALGDTEETQASASVVVTMENGATLTADKAAAIKNLIARAVRGMNFTNVSVFDAATMLEVDASPEADEEGLGAAKDMTALSSLIENSIAGNVRRPLEQIYGSGNVTVSVKGTLNMERLIQESTQYTTPEKTGDGDKEGLLYKEDAASENAGTSEAAAGGVAGVDANAEVPRYEYNNGQAGGENTYGNSSSSREWLFNSVKEQRQVNPGVLDDTSVGVVIRTDDMSSVTEDQLLGLVANSAGIPLEEAGQKITVIRVAKTQEEAADVPASAESAATAAPKGSQWALIAAAGAGALLLILLLVLLLVKKRRKKDQVRALEEAGLLVPPGLDEPEDGFKTESGAGAAAAGGTEEPDEDFAGEELINLRMQRNLKLKQNIGEFVDQNPQIAAKLIQSWLRGEEKDGGKDRRGRA